MGRLSDDFWNDPHSQEVRREVLKNDRQTFHSRAQADADLLNQGRFAKEQATTVVGATPSAPYAHQPSTSPWSQPDRNVEPPFGDVNEMDPVGTQAEIERSLDRDRASVNSIAAGSGGPVGDVPDRSSTPLPGRDAAAASFANGDAVSAQGRDCHSPSISPQPPKRRFSRRF